MPGDETNFSSPGAWRPASYRIVVNKVAPLWGMSWNLNPSVGPLSIEYRRAYE